MKNQPSELMVSVIILGWNGRANVAAVLNKHRSMAQE